MSVCFVITTYNRVALLERVVNTISNQLADGDATVIVDDCSSDTTSEYAHKLVANNAQFTYTCMDENTGVNAARQRGIEYAVKTGCKWLSFIDDDDELLPNTRQLFTEARKQHPQNQWIAFPSINADKENISTFPGQGLYSYIDDYMGTRDIRGDFQHFITVDIAQTCSFSQQFKNSEEWYFWIQVDQQASWLILNQPGVLKHYLDEGLSKTRVNKDRALQVAQLKANSLKGLMHKRLYGKLLRNYGKELVKSGQRIQSKPILLESIKLNPTSLWTYIYFIIAALDLYDSETASFRSLL